MKQRRDMPTPGDHSIEEIIGAVAGGEKWAGDALFHHLEQSVRTAVRRFFSEGEADSDDVVQETILAVYRYIGDRGGFEGDLIRFAITIARNRCRNILNQRRRRPEVDLDSLANWISHPEKSPLDLLLDREIRDTLRVALGALGEVCRALLRAFYIEERTIEEIRVEMGLKTVQGVYYRRGICLEEMAKIVRRRIAY